MKEALYPHAGEAWVTSSWRRAPRTVRVDSVENDEVTFTFDHNFRRSSCPTSAFLKIYTREELA